jgi:hypothetical protein
VSRAVLGYVGLIDGVLLAAPFSPYARLMAQSATIRGTVSDSIGTLLADVELLLHDLNLVVRTQPDGRFAFQVRAGAYVLTARQIGFAAVTWSFAVVDSVSLAIIMHRSAATLPRVVINGQIRLLTAKLVGFYERLRTSGAARSSYITRDDIERRNPARTSDLIRDRGSRASACLGGVVYLDGARMQQQSSFAPPAGKVRTVPDTRVAIDIIPPADIEALEIYRGPSTVPAQYNGTSPNGTPPGCVILVWTR